MNGIAQILTRENIQRILRDWLFLYNFEYIFLVKKMCVLSLRAGVPNFKVQGHFLQKMESSNPRKFLQNYTAKTPLCRKMFLHNVMKTCDDY